MNSNLKKIIMTALFAALACVATMSIRIPTPGTGGNIHPGEHRNLGRLSSLVLYMVCLPVVSVLHCLT